MDRCAARTHSGRTRTPYATCGDDPGPDRVAAGKGNNTVRPPDRTSESSATAERAPWPAIDLEPSTGEPDFGPAAGAGPRRGVLHDATGGTPRCTGPRPEPSPWVRGPRTLSADEGRSHTSVTGGEPAFFSARPPPARSTGAESGEVDAQEPPPRGIVTLW